MSRAIGRLCKNGGAGKCVIDTRFARNPSYGLATLFEPPIPCLRHAVLLMRFYSHLRRVTDVSEETCARRFRPLRYHSIRGMPTFVREKRFSRNTNTRRTQCSWRADRCDGDA